MPRNQWVKFTDEAVEWYWTDGRNRDPDYVISSGWLAKLYQNRNVLASVRNNFCESRPCLALWGPSQSGKSTLLSKYLDAKLDGNGNGGALHWGAVPVAFCGTSHLPEGLLTFNPYNGNNDASGCVTRFSVCEPDDYAYPVRIHLLSRQQIMHALACGYASECIGGNKQLVAGNSNRESIFHLEKIVKDIVVKLPGAGNIDRNAFEMLNELIAVLDLLVSARHSRYTGLDADGAWENTKLSTLLNNRQLIRNPSGVKELVARLLWDNQERITKFFEQLVQFRNDFPAGDAIRCTMEVGAVLVDFMTNDHLKKKDDGTMVSRAKQARKTVGNLSWESVDVKNSRVVRIGSGFSRPMDPGKFGLFQGVVRELVLPLRRENLPEQAQEAFEKIDLLDFPGVSNVAPGQVKEALLDLDERDDTKFSSDKLFSKVLKRGKTESLVQGYAHSLSIDSFLLMLKTGNFPPHPLQIEAGIMTWWRCFDPKYNMRGGGAGQSPLPVFLNLTFMGSYINTVVNAGGSLDQVLVQLEQFGTIAKPHVSKLYTTTYKHLPNGLISVTEDCLQQTIRISPNFDSRVEAGSWDHLVKDDDGGVGFMPHSIMEQMHIARRHDLIRQREAEVRDSFIAALDEHRFKTNEGGQQIAKDVEKIRAGIQKALTDTKLGADPARHVSLRLRQLMDLPADCLPPFPLNARNSQAYLKRCLRIWMDGKRQLSGMETVGLEDPALRLRLLSYMQSRLNLEAMSIWLGEQLNGIQDDRDARQIRLTISLYIQKHLFLYPDQHPSLESAKTNMTNWGKQEIQHQGNIQYGQSPHYRSVVEPFLNLLIALNGLNPPSRPSQPGDEEIGKLYTQALAAR